LSPKAVKNRFEARLCERLSDFSDFWGQIQV
jgi:hypothetical protein